MAPATPAAMRAIHLPRPPPSRTRRPMTALLLALMLVLALALMVLGDDAALWSRNHASSSSCAASWPAGLAMRPVPEAAAAADAAARPGAASGVVTTVSGALGTVVVAS